MSTLHRLKYLHRDVKPANILVTPSGHLELTDFGLSVHLGSSAPPNDVAGTIQYLAPEITASGLFGKPNYGQPADVWSLGVVLLELASGGAKPVYADHDENAEVLKILATDPTNLSEMQFVRVAWPDLKLCDLLKAVSGLRRLGIDIRC